MRVKRSVLEQMVKEELAAHLREVMNEGPKDEDDPSADVVDAEKDGQGKEKSKDQKPAKPAKDAQAPAQPGGEPKDLPVEDDPEADKDLEKDVAGEKDAEEDAEEVTGGKIADQVQGKTIQSVTMEPKSKTLPGAQEIVLTFREIPDPLKILVTKTGMVKFFFKGLHNEV